MAKMNGARFLELLDAFGADFRRWPASERGAAEGFAGVDGEAAEALRAAAALDRLLAAAPKGEVSDALLARILASAPAPQVAPTVSLAKAQGGFSLAGLARAFFAPPDLRLASALRPASLLVIAGLIGALAGASIETLPDDANTELAMLLEIEGADRSLTFEGLWQ